MNKVLKLCACSLGIILVCSLPSNLTKEVNSLEQQSNNYTHEEIISKLAQANIVYLGEHHDSAEDHQAQLEIITALYQQNSQIAIAKEMFQRPYQEVLDRYLAGEISETELREQTEYDRRWGFDWEYYAPILRFAKARGIPLLALNTSTEVTRKVASLGLESLTEEERRHIPPATEIHTDNDNYRQMIRKVYEDHAHGGHGNSKSFERFFTAQVLWDETMAEKIAEFYQANADYQIVVLAGRNHIIYGYGIPSRVARRLGSSELLQRSVFFGNGQDLEFQESPPADYFWQDR